MQHSFTRDVISNFSMGFRGHSDYADCRHSRLCNATVSDYIPSQIEKSFKKCEIKYLVQVHLSLALILIIIETKENNIVQWKVFSGSNVICSNPMFVMFQQIAGYSAGIDYPNFSEVPQGGSFSCQNRLPGKVCSLHPPKGFTSVGIIPSSKLIYTLLQDIMLIWKQDVKFGIGAFTQANNFPSFVQTEQFLIK